MLIDQWIYWRYIGYSGHNEEDDSTKEKGLFCYIILPCYSYFLVKSIFLPTNSVENVHLISLGEMSP